MTDLFSRFVRLPTLKVPIESSANILSRLLKCIPFKFSKKKKCGDALLEVTASCVRLLINAYGCKLGQTTFLIPAVGSMYIFLFVLTIGLVYEWNRGGLEWE